MLNMPSMLRRRFHLCKQLCIFGLLLFLIFCLSDMLTVQLVSMPEDDAVNMLPASGIMKDNCIFMSHCPQPPSVINISTILAEKFPAGSRHRLKYRLRHDDVIHDAPFPEGNELCRKYQEDWKRTWPVVRNVFDAYISDPQGITLVTHLTMNRLAAFKQTLQHWRGPISVSVYFKEHRTMEFLATMKKLIGSRHNLFVHAVLQGNEYYYPGNLLRNIASQNIETEFVFLLDGDLVPSLLAEKKLHTHRWKLQQRQAYVAPAFAFLNEDPGIDFEAWVSKRNLLKRMKASDSGIQTFEQYSYPPGHRKTNYTKWAEATDIYEVDYELGYEPYVLMFASDVQHYPETFLGLLHDKSSFFTTLKLKEVRFFVVPDVYLIHFAHPRLTPHLQEKECAFHLYRAWRHRMFVLYGIDPMHWKDAAHAD